jgi:hypothetical protein
MHAVEAALVCRPSSLQIVLEMHRRICHNVLVYDQMIQGFRIMLALDKTSIFP